MGQKEDYNKLLLEYKTLISKYNKNYNTFNKNYITYTDFKLSISSKIINSNSFEERKKLKNQETIELTKIMEEQRKVDKLKGEITKMKFNLNILFSKLRREGIPVEDFYNIK